MKTKLRLKTIQNEKGITIVALIIAIILLVILAYVSIIAIYNSKIVDYAVNGTLGYAEEAVNENRIFNKIEKLINRIEYTFNNKKSNGFVAFFDELYKNSTTSERYISVKEYNSDYAELNDKTITIKEPGRYTAFATVGRSCKQGYTTSGYIRIDGNIVENKSIVFSCSNTFNLTGRKSYEFLVEEDKPLTITYSISSDSTYGTYTGGSLLIVKRESEETYFKDGLVAVFNTKYRTSSTSEVVTPVTDYNKNYAESDGTIITIKEPGEYSAFASVGRSSSYGFTTYGRLRINGEIIKHRNGMSHICWAGSNGPSISEAYKHTFTVKEGEPLSINYNLFTDGAWDGTNCGALVIVKNS